MLNSKIRVPAKFFLIAKGQPVDQGIVFSTVAKHHILVSSLIITDLHPSLGPDQEELTVQRIAAIKVYALIASGQCHTLDKREVLQGIDIEMLSILQRGANRLVRVDVAGIEVFMTAMASQDFHCTSILNGDAAAGELDHKGSGPNLIMIR